MRANRQDRSNYLETIAHAVVAVVLFTFAMALNVTILAGAVSRYIA